MATNESYVMTSHNLLNYSGMLFDKADNETPFSALIGGKSRNTDSWKFTTSLDYTTGGGTSQPAITESASLTAPNPSFITRSQNTNVCQIFQETVAISYAKKSSMGQLSGLNIAGQAANPATELDFQVAAKMRKIAKDIEYTFVNGAYQDGTYDDVAYKTKGIIAAMSSNVIQASNTPALGYWMVAEMLGLIRDNATAATSAPTEGLVMMLNPIQVLQINADAKANGFTVIPGERNVAGLNVGRIITPEGEIGILSNKYVPVGTATFVNPAVCCPVYLDVPGKGNFFLEELAKSGAGEKYQIYGQVGLDYGAEWYHGKITGLAQTFTPPTYATKVYVDGGTIETTTPAGSGSGSSGAGEGGAAG